MRRAARTVHSSQTSKNKKFVSAGPYIPTLLKSGKLVSISKAKVYTPLERLCIMGLLFYT